MAGGQRGPASRAALPASRAALHSRQRQVFHPHPSSSLWGTFLVGTREGRGDRLELSVFCFFVTLHSSLAFYLLPGFKGSKAGLGVGEALLSCSLCCAHSPKGMCCLVCA